MHEYSPFGTPTATGSYTGNPFRFSSEVFDSETGLIYYNYRYYNPNLGRWINRDPIEEQGGWNLYTMVNNNSVMRIDQFGLWDLLVHMQMVWDAYQKSNCPPLGIFNFNDMQRLLRGSILPDVPYVGENLWGYLDFDWSIMDTFNFVMDSIAFLENHFGSLGYRHGMGGSGTPNQLRDNIVNGILSDVNAFRDDGNYLKLGAALHTLGDTFAPSHTARNKNGEILRYQDFNAQDSSKHKKGDRIQGNEPFYNDATKTLIDFLNLACNEACTEEDLMDYLKNGPLQHSSNVSVGGSVKAYSKKAEK